MAPGRPKHDDILTPREWEVLSLLKEGCSNEEIAERLGIGVNGAKYHVSNIISKLGVRSRKEAAEQVVAPRQRGFAFPAILSKTGLFTALAGSLLIVSVAALSLLAVGVAINGSRTTNVLPTSTVSAAEESRSEVPESTPALSSPINSEDLGTQQQVWIYADSSLQGESCLEFLPDMIPTTASPATPGKAVECIWDHGSQIRLTLEKDEFGVLHLVEVSHLVVTTNSLPQPYFIQSCSAIEAYLFPGNASPEDGSATVALCRYVPPGRGADWRMIQTWSPVLAGSDVSAFPPDTPCWHLAINLGSTLEAESVPIRCILALP